VKLKLWMRWLKSVLYPTRVQAVAPRTSLRVEGLNNRINPAGFFGPFGGFRGLAFDAAPEFAKQGDEPVVTSTPLQVFWTPFGGAFFFDGAFGGAFARPQRPPVSDTPAEATQFDVRLTSKPYVGEEAKLLVTALDAENRPVRGYTGTLHFESTDPTAKVPDDYTFTAADRGSHLFDVVAGQTGELTVTVTQVAAPEPDPLPEEPTDGTDTGMDLIIGEDVAARHDVAVVDDGTKTPTDPTTPTDGTTDPNTPTDGTTDPVTTPTDGTTDPVSTPADPTTPTDGTTDPTTPTDPVSTPTDGTTDPVSTPTDPTTPTDGTTDPATPTDPVSTPTDGTTDPTTPIDPSTPTDPTAPTDPVPPTDGPTDPTTPPIDPGIPTDPVPPTDGPTTPTDPGTETPTDPVDVTGVITFDVSEAPVATHFALRALPGTTVGDPTRFAVVPLDESNEPVANFTGIVHFTSSDPDAVLPADYTFTEADQGVHVFAAEFKTTGAVSLTATAADGTTTGDVTVKVSEPAGDRGFWMPRFMNFRPRGGWWMHG